jgi:hypothetical protein
MNNKPVAWGMLDKDGGIYDSISPEEHDREEGAYTIPLYTHPVSKAKDRFPNYESICLQCGTTIYKPFKELTDEEINDLIVNKVTDADMIREALRKAQNK